jgi:FPC/CPF motif-containing protein YcgG
MKHVSVTPPRSQHGLSATNAVPADFAAFVRSDHFPCVGAKSALAQGLLTVFEAGDFLGEQSDRGLHRALCRFGDTLPEGPGGVASFACLFRPSAVMSEQDFEDVLWARLQGLHDIDAETGIEWAAGVGCEPGAPDFSFSVGGVAYFVIGLHPGTSRPARRFCRPALVFNAHEQFEQLRRDGRYGRIQSIVRDREIARHGSINPMLTDFGQGPEAPQYSGRRVSQGWSCPLRVRT